MTVAARIRRLFRPLANTCLHPQWLVLRNARLSQKRLAACINGRLLDVGCGNKTLAKVLTDSVEYIGMDYPATVALGYAGAADVFGDARQLPFDANCFDVVTLLDVMEHLCAPQQAFDEAVRVIRPGGLVIVQTPFLYPLHDIPHDYQRWTSEGLLQLAERHPLQCVALYHNGRPLETAALLLNLGLAKSFQDALQYRRPALLLLPLAFLLIPLINLSGWLSARLFPDTGFMPMGYSVIFRKLS